MFAPLIPDVALVEFPPQNADLSNNTILPPFSITVLAAAIPDSPPPVPEVFDYRRSEIESNEDTNAEKLKINKVIFVVPSTTTVSLAGILFLLLPFFFFSN